MNLKLEEYPPNLLDLSILNTESYKAKNAVFIGNLYIVDNYFLLVDSKTFTGEFLDTSKFNFEKGQQIIGLYLKEFFSFKRF